MKEGAPLKVYTDRIADKLRQRFQQKAVDADVFVGMRLRQSFTGRSL